MTRSCPTLAAAVPMRGGDAVTRASALRHLDACLEPQPGTTEAALVMVAGAVTAYVDAMLATTEDDQMPGDYILNQALGEMLGGFNRLLAGDVGRLDASFSARWAESVAALIRWDLDMEEMMRGTA